MVEKITTVTLLLFFAQPSYARTFDTEEHCNQISAQADLWVTVAFETIGILRDEPLRIRERTEEIAIYMERANNYAGVYSAFCK